MKEKSKRYTVTVKITRDSKPSDKEQIQIEGIGEGKVLSITKSDKGKWVIEVMFEVDEFTEIMAWIDKRCVSKKLH